MASQFVFRDDSSTVFRNLGSIPLHLAFLIFSLISIAVLATIYIVLVIFAPHPRLPTAREKTYLTIQDDGSTSEPIPLPCWYHAWSTKHRTSSTPKGSKRQHANGHVTPREVIEPAELAVSIVVPAYNEEDRLPIMLDEAVEYLEQHHGSKTSSPSAQVTSGGSTQRRNPKTTSPSPALSGWEILVISDGSTDSTIDTALSFARAHHPSCASRLRAVTLEKNRGKGGAVTHGMRHVRGHYVLFADADGATRFSDLGNLIKRADEMAERDAEGRAVVVGSRAHLVGSEAVVKRSVLRNALMYAFHIFIRLLTTRVTSRIGDTQCGFKLFIRPALPYVIPYMHSEGWIFDVEMLMLAEAANIPMEEVPVSWKEVMGSKLDVIWDSLGMAWGLCMVRGAWAMRIWKRS